MPAYGDRVIAVTYPVEPGRLRDRQRPENHRIDEGEDRGRAANSQGECKHDRGRERARHPALPDGIPNRANREIHCRPSDETVALEVHSLKRRSFPAWRAT